MQERTTKDIADRKREDRIEAYGKAVYLYAIFAMGPVVHFVNNNIMNAQPPLIRIYERTEGHGYAFDDDIDIYNDIWASPEDKTLTMQGNVIGIISAIVLAAIVYLIARYLIDRLLYKADMRFGTESRTAAWIKGMIMGVFVCFCIGLLVFANFYDRYPEDKYIMLQDKQGNYYRVDKSDYEKYMKEHEEETEDGT